ncbi:MAG: hypothetical protein ACI9EF_002908, partial [Pseudohongiellaceae bacterium]
VFEASRACGAALIAGITGVATSSPAGGSFVKCVRSDRAIAN